ncbi:lipopolysaccharide assembly protein LapA domain-containing protein [Nocardia stercoris]|uniref:DUF1049 domain-containing protein n=1 Tax=Nocardia stercoris TaxID=2483361 RepID=A0A3M2KVS5_9NOCA|nr:lipopolysaccharide assembly protein LapA domain-containing protein [Nocardia stercoris]RMI29697.1 DUF1049 domain-containing protein [Nocardia stercoris]
MTSTEGGSASFLSRLSPKMVAGLIIAILALIFVFQNTHRGRVNIYFWSVEAPAWLWMLTLFVSGVVVGSVFPWFRRRRH